MNSSFRKAESQPVERVTPTDVLHMADRQHKTSDMRFLRTLGNQMKDDEKRERALVKALQAFVDYHATDYDEIPEMTSARRLLSDAPKEQILQAMEGEK